jgi:hypothetical protein
MPTTPTTPRRASRTKPNTATKVPTISLADVILGRNIPTRQTDRVAVSAELKRESSKLKEKKVDIGEATGPYDTDSVRDRVR